MDGYDVDGDISISIPTSSPPALKKMGQTPKSEREPLIARNALSQIPLPPYLKQCLSPTTEPKFNHQPPGWPLEGSTDGARELAELSPHNKITPCALLQATIERHSINSEKRSPSSL